MPKKKIAIALDADALRQVDRLVREPRYPSRSQAIEAAVIALLVRLGRRRLSEECANLDPRVEWAVAEEGLDSDAKGWPEY